MVPTIPAELEHMILAAMAPDPADRPSAIELQEQLAAFCTMGGAHATNAQGVAAWVKDMLAVRERGLRLVYVEPIAVTPVPRARTWRRFLGCRRGPRPARRAAGGSPWAC